jgi:hypothetical protein
MAVQEERLRIINIPARIILNGTGVLFFNIHNRILRRFDDSKGNTRFGFIMETIDLVWLKKMLLKGFVEKIEIKISEIARCNDVLSDTVRLVFFSMFRHRITLSVLDHVYNSPMLRAWNRANPKYSIGPGVNLPKQTLKKILSSLESSVTQIQTQLRKCIVINNSEIREKWDEDKKLDLIVDEIVRDLDPLIFFILVGSKEKDRMVLLKDIATQITAFINMIDVLDMASLLSVELASAAERSALLRAMMNRNVDNVLRDIPKLKPFLKENKFSGTTVVISIPRYTRINNEHLKFRISFYNVAADADRERKLMEDFNERNGRFGPEKRLDDFFQEEGVGVDNTMRFYYLTRLHQLCEKHDILMGSKISTTAKNNIDIPGVNISASVTTLYFGL